MTAPTCPPTLPGEVLGNGMETFAATVSGLTDYWTGALARAATPLDVAADFTRWLRTASQRRVPGWATPNEVILGSDIALLRDFSAGADDPVAPTLVLPPQAGHSSCIVDYSEHQTQLGVARAAGLTRLYAADWRAATQQTKHAGVEDYLAFVADAVARIGAPVNLVGDCQGGWLATIYAALHPEQVNTLTIAGAPIDFHAGRAVIHDYVDLFAQGRDMSFYEAVVALGNGVLRGEFMLNGFVLIKPENEVAKQLQLLAHIHEPEHVERYRAFEDWFKHTQDIAGTFYLWIVEHLFRDNALIGGELEIGGQTVDLARIDCPLHLLAGETDHITPPDQVWALGEAASTPAERITRRTTGGGHLGLFMGREALRDHWPPIFADVLAHSRHRAARRPAERRARGATPPRRREVPAP